METKSRLTLDNSGLRLRPRTYVDSHVPKRVVPRLLTDVSIVKKPITDTNTRSVSEISTTDIAQTAKALIEQKPSPTIYRRTRDESTVSSGPESIEDLVQAIQRKHDKTPTPAFYETSLDTPGTDALQDSELSTAKPSRFERLRNSWSRRSILASAMAVLLMVGGLVALFSSIHSNRIVTMQVQALSDKAEQSSDASSGQASSTDVPSEDKVPDAVTSNYSVASDMPKYLQIPKIKISRTRVLPMGIGDDGAIKTPRNVWDTGWYEGSSKPGDKNGAALIVGHVSGPTNGGIFYNLYRLTDGDEINVTMGDNSVYTYKVVAKEEVPADNMNMNNYLVSKNVDKPGLTIMTCSGEFNPKTQTFDHRLAVFAIRTN